MRIEVLVVDSCPSQAIAREAMLRALDDIGLAAEVTTVVVTDEATARARRFIGSPSFYVDDHDIFPVPGAGFGLTCRVYSTPAGLRGVPEVSTLRSALTARVAPSPSIGDDSQQAV